MPLSPFYDNFDFYTGTWDKELTYFFHAGFTYSLF